MLKHQEEDYPELEPLMTVGEMAEYLRVHTSSIYRLVAEGRLAAMRLGGTWRFKLSEVLKGLQRDVR